MSETNELLRADLRRDTELVADNIEVTKFPQMVHVTVANMRSLIADADHLARAEALLRETKDRLDDIQTGCDDTRPSTDREAVEARKRVYDWETRISVFLSDD